MLIPMKQQDDRTPEQKKTHILAIAATDSFMSGWGEARGGKSKVAWAYNPNEIDRSKLLCWVRKRSEMKDVNEVDLTTYRPKAAHFHIYVVEKNHPSQK